ncbi:MAG: phosphoribosylaminoimidazolesuccinocarboxamide synthase [Fimbriimonadaceae bacterium]|nr:phosphoribosylaminoimidazolesuccinocarboxamide synthase [Fimbriimonadaceae bacterium]
MSGLLHTTLAGRQPDHSGKVRDIYDLGDALLLVASDRISAFDCILPRPIPAKGRILTRLTNFWLDHCDRIGLRHHRLTADEAQFPAEFQASRADLAGRSMYVRKCEPILVECVARGYLAGSGWKEYRTDGTVCGIRLPAGLRESDQLPEPIFTPASKESDGHDINISFEQCVERIGRELSETLRDATIQLYRSAAELARAQGVIIADTKFEFGILDGAVILIDEILTPDSSRFWDVDEYAPGRGQRSMDKQVLRDWLETLDWDKQPPAPAPTDEVVALTAARYHEAWRRITGRDL